jgi:uncharacterized protein with PIN domain
VLDTSAVISLFRNEPAAALVARTVRDTAARMVTVNVAETVDVLVRKYGWTPVTSAPSWSSFSRRWW